MGSGFSEVREAWTPSFTTRAIVFLVVSAAAFPLVLGLGMTREFSHDEHQHVAAGALIAREGLVPYRDFPHFHTPYLPLIYALLCGDGNHLLMSGRLVSVLCATATLGVVGTVAYGLFRRRGRRFASLLTAGTVLLGLTAALFTKTSGAAWNHEPALFLALLAVVAHGAGLGSGRHFWWVASGLLLGLAIGTRITYAPLVAPFGLALFLHPDFGWRWDRAVLFTIGLVLGLAALFCLFALAPEQTVYGNFGFPGTNIVYRFSTGEPRTMTIGKKLRFFFKVIVRGDAALVAAGLLPLVAAHLAHRRTSGRLRFEARFLLLLLPFVFVGAFAPSPLFVPYFFPLVPFLLLVGLYAFASIPPQSLWFRRVCLVGAATVLLSVGLGVRGYKKWGDFFAPARWTALKVHREAEEIRFHLPHGRVLTLAPLYPLEAGLAVYPSFSTGPFAWRVSPYLEPARAARLGIVSPATLEQALAAAPPDGILVGFERTGEEHFAEYARRHGYRRLQLTNGNQLWLP